MIFQRVISFANGLEDPKHPLLGPNLKALYVYGLWQSGSKFRIACANFIHFLAFIFVCTQLLELWIVKDDFMKVLHNLSVTILSIICLVKSSSYILWQSRWKELVNAISTEEISQMTQEDSVTQKLRKNYTTYARVVTYLYWYLVVMTNITMISSPLLKYVTTATYREEISNGTEPYPLIMSSWFPFDKTKMPWYWISVGVHILMNIHGGGIVAVYDSNAVVIMIFLKGQMRILREKCKTLFNDSENIQRKDILDRIKECHRHHGFLLTQSGLFNSVLSPVMFLYVLVCSIMICCSVVQFPSEQATTSQKLWVLEYTTALVSQLFLYCWHSNEVLAESNEIDRGVFESDWWKADVRIRKQVILLAGKMGQPFLLSAGPFTTLSVPTFISVIKGSYSFYTLFTQMHENK
uniref:Odorant receptor n=1 Tax=Eogystia hippophaecolus TaxID=1206364 RepID=A0A1B3P5T6_EOGHI|nr:odorant receptor [Eogystia hippophaecolus]